MPSFILDSLTRNMIERVKALMADPDVKKGFNTSQFKTLAKHFTEGIVKTINMKGEQFLEIGIKEVPANPELLARYTAVTQNIKELHMDYQDLLTENGQLKEQITQLQYTAKIAAQNDANLKSLNLWKERCEELARSMYNQKLYIDQLHKQLNL